MRDTLAVALTQIAPVWLIVTLDAAAVRRERHNFDPSGHDARPEILRVHLDAHRHGNLQRDETPP